MAPSSPANSAPNPSARSAVILIAIALLAVILSIYQWIELIKLRTTSDTLFCSFSATFDCVGVWNSALAHSVHKATSIPIVGWGLAWSLVVLVFSVWLLRQIKKSASTTDVIRALRLTTGIGVLVSLLLLAYSVSIKVFCPTCILFYLLVAAAAYLAFRKTPTYAAAGANWGQPALASAGVLLVSLAVLIYPSLKTPREDLVTAQISAPLVEEKVSPVATSTPLEGFLNSLPMNLQQAVSDSLAIYRKSSLVDTPPDPKRITFGPANAPVHLVEWTDIRCPHCKNLETGLTEIRRVVEPGLWNQETRHFPLDSQCNSKVERAGDGTSCLAAKLQICLIDSPDFARVRSTLFERQTELTKELIWDIASKDPERRKALETCVSSPVTAAALKEDIEYADKHKIQGTPMVVINGHKTAAMPAAILSLIMAKGNVDDPAFMLLPSPDPEIMR